MRKLYRGVTAKPKLIIGLFLILSLAGLLSRNLVSVNYDLNDYLPSDSASTLAMEALEREFEGGIPNARVMIRDASISQALAYKEALLAVDGVTGVTWLDDVAQITMPLDMQDQDTVDTYYKDGNALFSVTIAEDKIVSAVEDIRSLIGDENAMSGSAVSTAVATTSTVSEIRIITLISVAFVALVLVLTTNSWVEPLIVLAGLGSAIAINIGSNLLFGEISFVSNAAGPVLQLAVSLDYSVFLIHRYEECRLTIADNREAMVEALCKSTMSILSSGLTTVIGFLALCLMRFRIGPDLGLVLAKGVAISLVDAFLFTPCLTLLLSGAMDKARHRSWMPSFRKLGSAVVRIMIPMAVIFPLVMVPAYLASNRNDYYYGSSKIFGPQTQLGADVEAIEAAFGKSDTYVLMVPRGDLVQEKALSDALHGLPEVTSILSYVDSVGAMIPTGYLDADTLSQLMSQDYSRMVLSVCVDPEGEQTFALVDSIRAIAQDYYPDQWMLAGEGVSTQDLMSTVTSDMLLVNLIAIGAVFVTLLLSLKSLSLPAILVLSIETAIWINLAVPYFAGQTIFFIAYLIISSIQLGATVDYAILFTDRYLEYRQTLGKKEAVRATVPAVVVSVLTSGLTMTVVGFLLGYLSTHGLLSQLGLFLGRGTLCSMAIVLFVLPGLLYLFDGLIRRTSMGLKLAPARPEKNASPEKGSCAP